MKVLLNTTTLRLGGSLQTSSAFIMQALANPGEIEWVFAASKMGVRELAQFGVEPPPNMIVFDKPPTFSPRVRRRLWKLEDEVNPDMVFTFSGPAYVRFRRFHLLGCSAGWVTHSTWTAYRSLGTVRDWAICAVRNLYKALWFRQADAWVMQTETAKRGLSRRLRVPPERISVILNTCGERYLKEQGARPFPVPGQTTRILCFSVGHKHKNLEILPRIAAELDRQRPDLDFRIVITLPTNDRVCRRVMHRAKRLGVTDRFENVGPVPVARGPELYRTCDISLLPTLLETFSANYPEAMAMGLPLVTTDLDFAHDVCGDAALYYPPQDAAAAAACVARLLGDRELWQRQIARGTEALKRFPTPRERYEQYVSLLLSLRDRMPAPSREPAAPVAK
ncbi:MAG: glycosyltransferase family 4 protein [Planctomycetia bacterium]|nr:glycosyltransferase family 4 protein [Planctomycetia bacterium]